MIEIQGKGTTSHLGTSNNYHLIKSHGAHLLLLNTRNMRGWPRISASKNQRHRDSYNGTTALARWADGEGSCRIVCTYIMGRRIGYSVHLHMYHCPKPAFDFKALYQPHKLHAGYGTLSWRGTCIKLSPVAQIVQCSASWPWCDTLGHLHVGTWMKRQLLGRPLSSSPQEERLITMQIAFPS